MDGDSPGFIRSDRLLKADGKNIICIMAKVTNFRCVGPNGAEIPADAHGNNVALGCLKCGHPVLIVTLPNQQGTDRDHPAKCRKCGFTCWADINEAEKTLRIRSTEPGQDDPLPPSTAGDGKWQARQSVAANHINMKNGKPKFDDILEGFEFVSSTPPMEHEAYLCRETGEVHFHSEQLADEEPLPDDITPEKYVFIPHKNDLNLGKPLVLKFTAEVMPDALGKVQAIFSRPGAYARFKDLLIQNGKLEQWYEYEKQHTDKELRTWCRLNKIKLDG